MPFAAAGVAAGIGAAGSIAGGAISASATSAASKRAIAEQRAAREEAREMLDPYMAAGAVGLERQNALLNLSGPEAAASAFADFTASPGYEWQVEQGLRAVDAGAAARGMLRSGATLKAEQQFGQNLANQSFGEYYGRISALADGGRQAAAAAAGQAISTGNNIAQTQASAATAQANAWSGAIQGAGNAVQQGFSNYAYQGGKKNALAPEASGSWW